jgi:hypothetical protein
MSVDDGFSRTELELAGAPNLPAPHDLVGMLRAKLEELVTNARNGRGEVHTPEDTFEIQLGLAQVIEGLTDYARAFQKIAREARGYAEDELIEAVGEQDGIPLAGLKVPDPDGTTVSINRDMANQYEFDNDTLLTAVAHEVLTTERLPSVGDPKIMTQLGLSPQDTAAIDALLVRFMLTAMSRLVELGKFEPQISKVKAFTTELSRLEGGPQIASTVTSSTRKKPIYKGVKVEREQPK